MEIHKEREAFERLPLAELAIESEFVFYNEETNSYWPNEDFCPSDAPEAMNFAWEAWRAAKAQAVPEKTVKLHLVWNENKDECVGFLDSKDARYTATGDDRGMFGVTALGDYFRDLNDERDEFETQIVMIEAQEQNA